jgi:hypothetical protein
LKYTRILGGCLVAGLFVAACADAEDTSAPGDAGLDGSIDGGSDGDADASGGAAGSAGTGGTGGQSGSGGSVEDSGTDADAADAKPDAPTTCGNGQLDPGEICEGDDFGGKTCASIGLGSGTLLCNQYCTIVATNCVPLESCTDGQDNDEDGLADCDDSDDCGAKPACMDSCASPKLALVPGSVYGNTTGKPSNLTPSCTTSTGSEAVYQLTAGSTGKLKLSSSGGAKLSISVRTLCNDESTEVACEVLGPNGEQVSVGVDVTAGQKLFVIIDEPAGEPGTYFDVQIEEVKPEDGNDCEDFIDNDVDDLVDCDDPDACQSSAWCVPGTGATGSACLQANQCKATGNDPVCLQDPQWPGGYCSEFCDPSSPCAAGALCYDLGISKHGVCLDACVTNADCRLGYDCVDKGLSSKVCFVPNEWKCGDFKDNDNDTLIDCEDPDKCQTLPACLTGPNPVGTTCSLANECQATGKDPLCLENQTFNTFNDGYCSEFCSLTTNDCTGGGYCSDFLGLASGNGVCLDPCVTPGDCRPNYGCAATGTGISVCVPFGVSP